MCSSWACADETQAPETSASTKRSRSRGRMCPPEEFQPGLVVARDRPEVPSRGGTALGSTCWWGTPQVGLTRVTRPTIMTGPTFPDPYSLERRMELSPRTVRLFLTLALASCAGCDSGETGIRGNASFGDPDPLTTPLRPAESPTPAAPVCAFQDGRRVTFEIVEGIPNPRCARATQDQGLALTNHARELISIDLGGGPL